jgi:hypothetical protein
VPFLSNIKRPCNVDKIRKVVIKIDKA